MTFTREKKEGLDGRLGVYYECEGSDFKIVATRDGVQFRGTSPWLEFVVGSGDALALAKAIGDAGKDVQTLRPKLTSTLSGH